MVEVLLADALPELPREEADRETLSEQVVGILREVLEGPALCEAAKVRLRRLLVTHRGHPERALLEHLREMGVEPPAP
ncbi:hypothetical protein [Sinomonas terrae]|jgi:hypothetical protein|uniref:Uncharacterized protein n=1 Tax=Sinomonas terrae TaxID=2908838 RepID=A0ABS9TXN5_9MICC|nr:hypothetical protein [Sinomonas terrae]MCH6469218.1 hypothetical protein [Sinomonas terrae]